MSRLIIVVLAALSVLTACRHARQQPPPGEVTFSADGVALFVIRGRAIDATTKAPIGDAQVSFTDIGCTYAGSVGVGLEDREPPRQVSQSTKDGCIDNEFDLWWGMTIGLGIDSADDAVGIDELSMRMDRAVTLALAQKERTFCIDVCKAGYRRWAGVFTDSDCSSENGRAVIELGTIELTRLPDMEEPLDE